MSASSSGRAPLSAGRAILFGTITVGTLDMLDALIFFGLRGVRLSSIPQAIAGGLLGRAAFQGGIATVLLGLALHYFIAFSIVTTFYLASRRIDLLTARPIVSGLIYGVGVYLFMSRVVVPLSGAAGAPPTLPVIVNGTLIHMFGVGLPSALFAGRVPRVTA